MHRRGLWTSALLGAIASIMFAGPGRVGVSEGWKAADDGSAYWQTASTALPRGHASDDNVREAADALQQRAKRGPPLDPPTALWVGIGAETPCHWLRVPG